MEKRLLIADRSGIFSACYKNALSEKFMVEIALNKKQAARLIEETYFNVIIFDIDFLKNSKNQTLGDAVNFAVLVADLKPRTAIVLTGPYSSLLETPRLSNDFVIVEKEIDQGSLLIAIDNAIYRKHLSPQIREKRFSILSQLPLCKSAVNLKLVEARNEGGGYVESMTGIMKSGLPIKWVVYRLPEHEPDTCTIGLVSSVGCGLGCAFCASRRRSIKEVLSTPEIVAQVLHGLDSYQAKGLFEDATDFNLRLSFTCEGDMICSNFENGMRAIREINASGNLRPEFIITTIGHEKKLALYLARYSDLKNVFFYWSLHFMDELKRGQFMPATRGHSLTRMIDLFDEIAQISGRKVTASFILMRGINDDAGHAAMIAEKLGGRENFLIKLQPLRGDLLPDRTTGREDLAAFRDLLIKAGVPEAKIRIRGIIGDDILAGCGTTVPGDVRKIWLDKEVRKNYIIKGRRKKTG